MAGDSLKECFIRLCILIQVPLFVIGKLFQMLFIVEKCKSFIQYQKYTYKN
jgi:hypothetical protein